MELELSAHGPDGLSIRDSNQAGPGSLKKVLPQDEQVVRFNMTGIGLAQAGSMGGVQAPP